MFLHLHVHRLEFQMNCSVHFWTSSLSLFIDWVRLWTEKGIKDGFQQTVKFETLAQISYTPSLPRHFGKYEIETFGLLWDICLIFMVFRWSLTVKEELKLASWIIKIVAKLSPSLNSSFSLELRWLYYQLDPASHPVKYQIDMIGAR